jgi:protein subunit release factor A
MYQKFSGYKKWKFEILETDTSDGGGFKVSTSVLIGGSSLHYCPSACKC